MQFFKKATFLITIFLFSSISFADQRDKIDEFVTTFKAAVSNGDISEIVKMNEWSGLADVQKKSIEASFSDISKKGILSLRVEKISNGESIVFKKKENTFSPNLVPVAKLFIEVETKKRFRGGYSYYIGQTGSELKFCHVVLKGS